jgi:transcriptional regulator with XRE-family HTH domain
MITDIFIKLKKLRESLGLKQSDVAACTDMSQRDISLLENGHKEFIPTSYIVFYTRLGIDVRWIFNGRPYEEDSAYLREFVKKLSMKNLSGTDLVKLYQRKMAEGKEQEVARVTMPVSEVWVIPAAAGRSYVQFYNDPAFLDRQDRIQLPMAEAYSETFRCFQTEGDRMAPGIAAGDYLIGRLVDTDEFSQHDGSLFIVVSHDLAVGRLTRRQKSSFTLTFDNPGYPARHMTRREIKELWLIRWRLTRQVSGGSSTYLEDIQRRLEDLEQRLKN